MNPMIIRKAVFWTFVMFLILTPIGCHILAHRKALTYKANLNSGSLGIAGKSKPDGRTISQCPRILWLFREIPKNLNSSVYQETGIPFEVRSEIQRNEIPDHAGIETDILLEACANKSLIYSMVWQSIEKAREH